jgi:endonuclease-8
VPEGDTIHRAADRLRPALAGQPLVRLEAPRAVAAAGRRPAPGSEITAVDAVGKHLLIRFAGGHVLRTHLRMSGSWHLYRPGERWRRPVHAVRALVEVPGWVAVCFDAPVVAFEHEQVPGGTDHLGPDLTTAGGDGTAVDECLRRMGALADTEDEIGATLLDQRIACGVGNVFKSEVLWACRVDPFLPVGEVGEDVRRRLLVTASQMLRHNAGRGGPRATYGGGVAVYRRRGRPCPRCGTAIRMRRQGAQARSTYWCPTCQRPGDGGDG